MVQLAQELELPLVSKEQNPESHQENSADDGDLGDFDAEHFVAEAADIVLCLVNLMPSLLDPTPDEGDMATSPRNNPVSDIESAALVFPRAPAFIHERLGVASWKRRQQLKLVRQSKNLFWVA